MDLGIKELGITLIVGVFTLLGAEVIAHFLFNRPLTTFFHDVLKDSKETSVSTTSNAEKKEGGDKDATVMVATFAALVFAVGVVVETVSYKYVDDQTLIFKTLPAMVLGERLTRELGMPPKDDDRVAALVGSLDHPKRSPLAVDLAHSDAFLISDNARTGLRVQNWLKQGCEFNSTDCATPHDIQQSVENLYYYAKNMAYSDENHYNELGQIQARLEFARSLSLIGILGLTVVVGFVAFSDRRAALSKGSGASTAGLA